MSLWVDRLLVALILVNLVAVALQSVPSIDARYALVFDAIEVFSLVVFTTEYALRLWAAAEHGPHRHLHPMRARLKYVLSPAGLVDLIAVLPFWFALVLPADFRVVLVFRIVRFFKITRYSPAMRSLLDVLYRERRALFGCLVITLGIALVAATAHASRRRPRAARQARHHSGSAVVGDRDARHHRLWRRGASDRARQTDRLQPHRCRIRSVSHFRLASLPPPSPTRFTTAISSSPGA